MCEITFYYFIYFKLCSELNIHVSVTSCCDPLIPFCWSYIMPFCFYIFIYFLMIDFYNKNDIKIIRLFYLSVSCSYLSYILLSLWSSQWHLKWIQHYLNWSKNFPPKPLYSTFIFFRDNFDVSILNLPPLCRYSKQIWPPWWRRQKETRILASETIKLEKVTLSGHNQSSLYSFKCFVWKKYAHLTINSRVMSTCCVGIKLQDESTYTR